MTAPVTQLYPGAPLHTVVAAEPGFSVLLDFIDEDTNLWRYERKPIIAWLVTVIPEPDGGEPFVSAYGITQSNGEESAIDPARDFVVDPHGRIEGPDRVFDSLEEWASWRKEEAKAELATPEAAEAK